LKVRFYGFLRDYVGGKEFEVSLKDGSVKASELPEVLASLVPGFVKVLDLVRKGEVDIIYLLNGKPLREGDVVNDSDVVEVLPPASGG